MLQNVLRGFDVSLCKVRGIFAFDEAPDCILRVQVEKSTHSLQLPCGIVAKGEPIVHLHIWNGHLPRRPRDSQDLAWAARTWRQFLFSLHQLTAAIPRDPRLSIARAIGGSSSLFTLRGGSPSSGVRLMQKIGFTVLPYYRPWGRFGEWMVNTYSWWLLWAYNPASIKNRDYAQIERTEVWISTPDLIERFGSPLTDAAGAAHLEPDGATSSPARRSAPTAS